MELINLVDAITKLGWKFLLPALVITIGAYCLTRGKSIVPIFLGIIGGGLFYVLFP